MRGRRFQIIGGIVLAAVALVAGCGNGDGEDGLARLAPPDAPLYIEATVRPDGDQREALDELLAEVAPDDDVGAELIAALDESFASAPGGFSYAENVEPWLGERGAVFVRSFESSELAPDVPDFAAILETDDPDAANEEIERLVEADPEISEVRGYGGFDYHYGPDVGFAVGIVDDSLVLGTETSFKVAVDALAGESLAESVDYAERFEALGDEQLATVYLDPSSVIEAAIASRDISRTDANAIRPLLAGPLSSPAAIGLSAASGSASVDVVAAIPDGEEVTTDPDLLGGLPGNAWLALALPEFGQELRRSLDQLERSGLPGAGDLERQFEAETGLDPADDILAHLGDVTGYVAGTSPFDINAGVLAEVADSEGVSDALEVARDLVEREIPDELLGPPPEGAEAGFTVNAPGLVGAIGAGVIGDRLVGGFGVELADVLDPPDALADDELFQAAVEALGDEVSPGLYLHLPTALGFAQLGGAGEDPDFAEALPYLERLAYLIVGARMTDGLAVIRLTIGLE